MPTISELAEELKEVKSYFNLVNERLERIEDRLSIRRPEIRKSAQPAVRISPEAAKRTGERKKDLKPGSEDGVAGKEKRSAGLEEKIGFQWFARIGIICIVLGMGFFLKYAFDNNWIGHLGRVIIGVVIGLALIAGGEIFNRKEKYLRISRIITGGGFAVLYFSVFSAYHFAAYRDAIGITLWQDIMLLSVVVLLAIVFSMRYNSQAILSASFFLGYLTAFLSNDFGLFTLGYCLILTIALAFVTSIKRWGEVAVGGAVATYLVFMIWYFDYSGSIGHALYFLLAYFIIFTASTFFFRPAEGRKTDVFAAILAVINSFFFYAFIMFWLEDKGYGSYEGVFTLLMGVVYLALAYFTLNYRKHLVTHLTLCILFLTLTPPIQFDGQYVTIIWALEALSLIYISLRLNTFPLRMLAYSVAPVVVCKTLFIDSVHLSPFDIHNIPGSTRLFSYVSSIVSFYIISRLLNSSKEKLPARESIASKIYHYSMLLMIIVLIALEMNRYWITVGWGMVAITMLILGFIHRSKDQRLVGIILLGLSLLKLFLFDMSSLNTIYRFISFIGLGLILLAAAFLYARYKDVILGGD